MFWRSGESSFLMISKTVKRQLANLFFVAFEIFFSEFCCHAAYNIQQIMQIRLFTCRNLRGMHIKRSKTHFYMHDLKVCEVFF